MKYFSYSINTMSFKLETPDIMMIKEFADLVDTKRNKVEGDSKGEKKKRALCEMKYIYLAYDWQSPYSEYDEQKRMKCAIRDSGMNEKWLSDKTFIAARDKYIAMQNESRDVRMLNAVRKRVDGLIEMFENVPVVIDGKPNMKSDSIIKEIQVSKVLDELDALETRCRKKLHKSSGTRGDAQEGFESKY